MKQIFQNFNNGNLEILDTPRPNIKKDYVIIETINSLISRGTEKMLIDFGKSNLIAKAISQPDRVKEVFNKVSTEGIYSTFNKVNLKLNEPVPMGYCNVGYVIDSGCNEFKVGDRVVSNGNHAEIVIVNKNLCSLIPTNVSNEDACFTVLSSIALNGIRLIKPEIGNTVVVYGLGLIGLITCQLLLSSGCNVIGIDIDYKLTNLASKYGVKTICSSEKNEKINYVNSLTNDFGADSVIITASSKKEDIINESAQLTRKKGSIVLIGVVDLKLNRDIFYKKEITFQVSSSYGPDRYEQNTLNNKLDIPPHYLRWNVKRNFETCLNLISTKKLNFKDLVTHEFKLLDYKSAYELLNKKDFSLGILLKYQSSNKNSKSKVIKLENFENKNNDNNIKINFIGMGNYAKTMLFPILKNRDISLGKLITHSGSLSAFYGRKYKFEEISTDINNSFTDGSNTIMIATQHNTHAEYVIKALDQNKNVYVEKPLCIEIKELQEIKKCYFKAIEKNPNLKFLVGFNRRFSPHVLKVKEILKTLPGPKSINMMINSGRIDKHHWINNKEIGGGRLIGEACHFLDLAKYIIDEKVVDFSKNIMHSDIGDTFSINLKFQDGSISSINYFSNGNKSYPKEKIEIFANGNILLIDNFKNIKIFDSKINLPKIFYKQDKGQENMISFFFDSIINKKDDIIPVQDLFEIAELSILIDSQ